MQTVALFSFIGAVPRTDWLPKEIERDAKGFVRTGIAVAQSPYWTSPRQPFLLETSRPGVFAVVSGQDVLNTPGINPYYGPLTGIADEAFDKILANNLKSVLWLAAMTLPGMAQRGGGSFILVGSIGGILANTVIGAYGISKAAGHHLVRNLAAEWGPRNIRVNAIAPGLVRTEFARALWEDEKRRADRIAATPLRRLGEPRDIGGIAVFLASPAAAFVTGQCIVADGGVTIL